uniref:IC97/Casc1 N-terminal domain-containing protein n=1 Tax=Homalodisca liturata TaxID=320908 RepID=A0A1B6JCL1_9HEMI
MAKKKLTKKEKQRLAEAEAKRKAAEEEAERLRLQKEEKERLKREAREAKERAEREVAEHYIRIENLGYSCELFKKNKEVKLQHDIALREAEEWKMYLECNGLPNPGNVSEMNTYLFLWKLDKKTNYIDDNLPKTQEVLNLLNVLNSLIDNPLNNSRKQIDNWKEVRDDFREELQNRLDKSSFHLLRQLETNMTQVDLEMVTYLKECPYLTLCLWTLLKIPRAFNDSRPPPFVEFPQVGVTIQLPPRLTHTFLVVRALWVKYDHFSDLCPTWEAKPLPNEYMRNLNDVINEEWEEKQKIKQEQEAEDAARLEKMKKKTKKRYTLPPPEVTEAGTQSDPTAPVGTDNKPAETVPASTDLPSIQTKQEEPPPPELVADKPQEPRKKPSEIMEERELLRINELRTHLQVIVEPGELNMRRYTVLGGVFHLDLLEQPPQPKILQDRTLLTVLEGEHKLQHIDYYEEYRVTLPDKDNTSDETDAETKATMESEQLKLVAINIALPESVLWFEPPTAVQWVAQTIAQTRAERCLWQPT